MNKKLQQSFVVPFDYPVYFTDHIFNPKNSTLATLLKSKNHPKVLYVADEGVVSHHTTLLSSIENFNQFYKNNFQACNKIIVIPGGETAKNNPKYVERILDAVNKYGVDRHSFIVGIGGGAVLDAVGFAAAIAHRGIRHIRIPTTVLSQNDSGIGVKNGINSYHKKNFLGTFAPPFAVVNDFQFLTTLETRDWRAGISEAIKVALIKDATFFQFIYEHADKLNKRDKAAMQQLIFRCAEMHMEHIAGGDPFEMGSSRPLDFGHWSAHKLEQLTNYSIRHGEAVAIGMALDVTYSFLKGMITEAELNTIIELLLKLEFPLFVPEMEATTTKGKAFSLIAGLEEFREHLGGELTIMLLETIGKGVEVHELDTDLIQKSIVILKAFHHEGLSV